MQVSLYWWQVVLVNQFPLVQRVTDIRHVFTQLGGMQCYLCSSVVPSPPPLLPSSPLSLSSHLSLTQVQKSLLVLMQHGLVRCEAGGVGLYEFNLTRLLAILYYPKYIAAVKVCLTLDKLYCFQCQCVLYEWPWLLCVNCV